VYAVRLFDNFSKTCFWSIYFLFPILSSHGNANSSLAKITKEAISGPGKYKLDLLRTAGLASLMEVAIWQKNILSSGYPAY
jgi:hypothetical protein